MSRHPSCVSLVSASRDGQSDLLASPLEAAYPSWPGRGGASPEAEGEGESEPLVRPVRRQPMPADDEENPAPDWDLISSYKGVNAPPPEASGSQDNFTSGATMSG